MKHSFVLAALILLSSQAAKADVLAYDCAIDFDGSKAVKSVYLLPGKSVNVNVLSYAFTVEVDAKTGVVHGEVCGDVRRSNRNGSCAHKIPYQGQLPSVELASFGKINCAINQVSVPYLLRFEEPKPYLDATDFFAIEWTAQHKGYLSPYVLEVENDSLCFIGDIEKARAAIEVSLAPDSDIFAHQAVKILNLETIQISFSSKHCVKTRETPWGESMGCIGDPVEKPFVKDVKVCR